MIAVFQDEEGLRIAAAELFEEAFESSATRTDMRAAEDGGGEADVPESGARTLSHGYYMWLEFIARCIDQPMETGVRFDERALSAEELSSLEILRKARLEFRRKHPPCRGCGKPLQNEWDKTCNDCQREAEAASRGARR